MTRLDWIILAVVARLIGLWQGLASGVLSAAGVVIGRAPRREAYFHVLPAGSESPYTPLVALIGAAAGAIVIELIASSIGVAIKQRLRASPLRLVDAVGGLAFGIIIGLAVIWILAAVALQLPGQVELRRDVQRSAVVQELNVRLLPPREVLTALARVDPFPSITGPLPAVDPRIRSRSRPGDPRGAAERRPRTRDGVRPRDLQFGWVAGPNIVVTDAHVIAGQTDTTADGRPAVAIAFDRRNDIAVLRVMGLNRRPLRQVDASQGTPVAIAGYPANGPLHRHRGVSAVRRLS